MNPCLKPGDSRGSGAKKPFGDRVTRFLGQVAVWVALVAAIVYMVRCSVGDLI